MPNDSSNADISALGISVVACPCSFTSASLISNTRSSEARLSSVAEECSRPACHELLLSSPRRCGLPPAECDADAGESPCPFFLPRET
jgi:hypothetical protein